MIAKSEPADEGFMEEITRLWSSNEFSFAESADPLEIVKSAVLQFVCGRYDGGQKWNILHKMKLVSELRLTLKGQEFLWWAFGEGRY